MNELVKIKNLSSREEKVSYIIQNKERFKWERNGIDGHVYAIIEVDNRVEMRFKFTYIDLAKSLEIYLEL
jgi:hypothetical protein